MTARYDLLLAGATVLDPAQGTRAVSDVAFASGQVAAVGPRLARAGAAQTVDCAGLFVAPGMIDLHVHVFYGVSHYGIEPDPHCVAKGVTTAVDAGSAGADTFPGFRNAASCSRVRHGLLLERNAKDVRTSVGCL